jgi:3-oxoacyl-[acyl-carrier-protein] synthase III
MSQSRDVMSDALLVLGHCFWQAGVGSRVSELPSILSRFPHGSHRSNHLDRSLFAWAPRDQCRIDGPVYGVGKAACHRQAGNSTGIGKRFYVPDDWVTSDLALMACKEALKRAGRKPEDVDLIILGTTSPDYITPSTSVVLQHKLGAKNAGAFDVGCACAAFPALVAIGAGLITTNPALKTVLLVGVDMIHRLTDPNDPGCFLWSDGAGAAVLEGDERRRRQGPPHHDAARSRQSSVNEDNWPRLFRRLSTECGFTADQVDQLIFTQISKPSIAIAAERCKVPIRNAIPSWRNTATPAPLAFR